MVLMKELRISLFSFGGFSLAKNSPKIPLSKPFTTNKNFPNSVIFLIIPEFSK